MRNYQTQAGQPCCYPYPLLTTKFWCAMFCCLSFIYNYPWPLPSATAQFSVKRSNLSNFKPKFVCCHRSGGGGPLKYKHDYVRLPTRHTGHQPSGQTDQVTRDGSIPTLVGSNYSQLHVSWVTVSLGVCTFFRINNIFAHIMCLCTSNR